MKSRVLLIICVLLAIPIVMFEYFVFLWFWGGDGIFTFFSTPIVFIIYAILQIVLTKKFRTISILSTCLKFSTIILTPLVTILTVIVIAEILGITIAIQ